MGLHGGPVAARTQPRRRSARSPETGQPGPRAHGQTESNHAALGKHVGELASRLREARAAALSPPSSCFHLLAQGQNPMPCPRFLRLLRPCWRQTGAQSVMAKLRRRPPFRQRARDHLPRPHLEPPRNQGQTAGSPRQIDREIHRGLKRYIARSPFRSHNRFGGLSSTFRTPLTPHPGSSMSRAPIMPGTGRAAHLSRHRNRLSRTPKKAFFKFSLQY